LAGALRTFGVGGLFGYYGAFWSPSLGSFSAYLTRRKSFVLVDTRAGRMLLSPSDAGAMLDALRAAKEARGETLDVPALKKSPASRVQARIVTAVVAVILLVGVGAGGLGAYAAWHAHGEAPRAVYVAGDAVRIERVDAPAIVLPLSDVRSAQV